jgi:hypothetical protein
VSVYQIVYCSKNRITGPAVHVDAALEAILTRSRSRNQHANVSGALLFNGAAFAQVLEGSLPAIEDIFEDIQCDPRHEGIVLLRNARSEARIFSGWSMAYADPHAARLLPHREIDLDAAFADPTISAPAIVALLQDLVVHSAA